MWKETDIGQDGLFHKFKLYSFDLGFKRIYYIMFTQTMVPWSIIVQVVIVLILLSSLMSSQVSSLKSHSTI